MSTQADVAIVADDAHERRERRTRRRWVTRDGLSTLVFLLPFLFVFGLFSWFPILRAFVMSVQDTNLVSDPVFVGLENFRRVLADPLLGIAVRNTAWFALLALRVRVPDPDHPGGADERGPQPPRAVQRPRLPARRRSRPSSSVLLWRFFFNAAPTGVFNTILGWFGIGPLPWLQNAGTAMPSIVIEATWAAAGATVIIYLAALTGVRARAVRRGRGRRRVDLAEDLAHHAAPAAGRAVRDPDPAADRHGPAVHGAAPVHGRRAGELDDDRAAADLQVRLPEQPGRRLRHGRGAERDARRVPRACSRPSTSGSPVVERDS